MSNSLIRDANAHVQAERETEEVVHENQRLQKQGLLRARLQITMIFLSYTTYNNNFVYLY